VIIATEGAGEVAQLSKATLLTKLAPRLEKIEELAPAARTSLKVLAETTAKGVEAVEDMCFVAGTLVRTRGGYVAIESIQPGDEVLSRDETSGEQEYKPVLRVFRTHPTRLIHLTYVTTAGASEALTCTPEHPFFSPKRAAFVPAKDLQAGDTLLLAEGAHARVLGLAASHALDGRSFTTFNLAVADYHTYFVGPSAVWVHNLGATCQELGSLLQHIKAGEGLDDWGAFKRVMEETVDLASTTDGALPEFAQAVFKRIYKNANGNVTKVPKIEEVYKAMGAKWVKTAFGGKGGWVNGRHAMVGMQNHHTAVIAETRDMLGRALTQEEMDSMPAILLKWVDNTNKRGSGGFHEVLEAVKKANPATDNAERIENLVEAYRQWDPDEGPAIAKVVRNWLRGKGIE